ncbi:MAG TPA: protein kinase, partial [Planctomycetota bacterium]|nr:protein kinase [Planctomycetota bacterium]
MTGDPEGDRQEILLGKLALERKLLTPEQLREALAEQARPKPDGEEKSRSLGNILVQRGFVTVDQLVSLLGQQSPAPAAPPGTVSKTLGKYSLLRVVGRGGMGVVYEAMDTALDRRVALKTMHPNSGAGAREARDEEERFLREAKLSATLAKHPNIVSVYEAGVIEGKRFIAMEFIRGKSLAQWAKSGSITIRQQVGVLRDVARGVHHAHKQGVIHRDLKPENILVDAENQPHITDFGLAKMIGQNVGLSLTAAGMAMGTPAFMSPEQAQGLKSIDARTDVYSLGVMLYEILTGRRPFTGETAIEILMKAAQEPVPRPSLVVKPENHATLDAAIENICLKALAKNRDERYPTAEAFADDLTRWISGEAVTAVPPAEPKKVVPSRRPRILVGVAAAAVLLALVGAIALSRRTPDSDLARAQKLLAAGKAGEAREAYQAILGRDPGNSEALSGRDAALAKLELAESRRKLEQLNSTDDKKPPENDLRGEPPGAEAWAHAVDLLALIDPSRDNVSGTWIRQEEHLVSDRQPRSRIEIPYHPPDEYDLRVVFTRTAGTGPVSVLLARSGRNFQWTMGTGLGGLVFAFETVRGALAGINPTTSRESQGLGTGASHTTIVQVRRDSIRAFFDGRLLSQWKTGGADLGLLLPHRLRDPRLLGLLTQASSVSFERVDLLAVSGAGEPLVQGPRPLLKAQAVDGASLKPGMVAEYASGTAFEIPVLRRIDPVINFRWGDGPPWPGGPIDWFSCRWTGYLKAPKVGDYVFTMTSDEGARVTLDDVAILTNWVPHLETSNSVTVMLETGFH